MVTIYFNEYPAAWPNKLAVDLETTGLDPYTDHPLSIALSDGKDVWIFLHTYGFTQALVPLSDPSILHIFHGANFDVKWIKKFFNIEVENIYCTLLAEQVLLGGREGGAGLDDVAARRVGIMMDKSTRKEFVGHPGFHKQLITSQQINYMAGDVLYLIEIMEQQIAELNETAQMATAQLEFDCIPAFVDLELSGFAIDIEKWYEAANWYTEHIQLCDQKMRELVGSDVIYVPGVKKGQPIRKEYPADTINFGSPIQMKAVLYQRYNLPVSNTDRKKTLEPILRGELFPDLLTDDSRKFIETLEESRTWEKYLGWNFPKHINSVTGKVHSHFHQIGADTGRASCSDPGMHQIPKPVYDENHQLSEPNLRHIWVADDLDHVLLRVDYGQQEVRVMAHMCQDPALINACNEDDIYLAAAKILYGRDVAKDSEERQITKAFVLATGYAAGIDTLVRSSGRPRADVEKLYEQIAQAFPVMANFKNKTDRFLRANGYVLTALGRRRYIVGNKRQYAQAVNAPIQGTSADMFKIALKDIHRDLTNLKKDGKIESKTRVWHVIHDEIVVQCHANEIDIIQPIVIKRMEEAGQQLCPSVKHIAEPKVSYRWDK